MRNFLFNIFRLFLLFGVPLLIWLISISWCKTEQRYTTGQTESNLLTMPDDSRCDILMMGISHARNFSRHGNHSRVESILDASMVNIGMGDGLCGVNDQLFYLQTFYSRGNWADTIIYWMSPPLLWSDFLNQSSKTFSVEPFSFNFYYRYACFDEAENRGERLWDYIHSKFTSSWFNMRPLRDTLMAQYMEAIDTAEIRQGFEQAYLDGMDTAILHHNFQIVEQTISLATKHHAHVLLIIPPALFGRWPGHDEVWDFMKEKGRMEDVTAFDHARVVDSPLMYYDHHHLNSRGVSYYCQRYLLPLCKHNKDN